MTHCLHRAVGGGRDVREGREVGKPRLVPKGFALHLGRIRGAARLAGMGMSPLVYVGTNMEGS